jgi:hypothetical protein
MSVLFTVLLFDSKNGTIVGGIFFTLPQAQKYSGAVLLCIIANCLTLQQYYHVFMAA